MPSQVSFALPWQSSMSVVRLRPSMHSSLKETFPPVRIYDYKTIPSWYLCSPRHTASLSIYAHHPSENICTENLTPFLKLLPCKSRSGIASLLNPHRLFDADWHGISIRVLWKADYGVEVQLGVQAVFDPIRLQGQKKRGNAVLIQKSSGTKTWSRLVVRQPFRENHRHRLSSSTDEQDRH
jgi:Gpi16 subunit, GPI transamidase component